MKWASTNNVSTIILLVNSVEDAKQGWKRKICFLSRYFVDIIDHWGLEIAALSVSLHHHRSLLDLTLQMCWSGQITEKIVLNFCNMLLAGVIFLCRRSIFHVAECRCCVCHFLTGVWFYWSTGSANLSNCNSDENSIWTHSHSTHFNHVRWWAFLAEGKEPWCDMWRSLFYLLYIFNAKPSPALSHGHSIIHPGGISKSKVTSIYFPRFLFLFIFFNLS